MLQKNPIYFSKHLLKHLALYKALRVAVGVALTAPFHLSSAAASRIKLLHFIFLALRARDGDGISGVGLDDRGPDGSSRSPVLQFDFTVKIPATRNAHE